MRAFFAPTGCAVVGASRDPLKPGHQILQSMLDAGFPAGKIYPVNPREAETAGAEIAGLRVYPDLASIPGTFDLAVVMVPGKAQEAVLADVAARAASRGDLRAMIVTAGGYAETGSEDGRRRQERLLEVARAAGVRLMGPNCVGVIDTHSRLDTTFLHGVIHRPGRVSFVSQSGAIGAWFTQMLSSEPEPLPFSKFVSLGNMADVTMDEVLDFLRDDPLTGVIGLYLEGTAEPRSLLASLAALAESKPVVAIKTGRTDSGRQAATSHTGALAGADRVWDGALRQAGVIRVDRMEEFVDLLSVLAGLSPDGRSGSAAERWMARWAERWGERWTQSRAESRPRVFLITHAGGPGVYTMDLLADHEKDLAPAVVLAKTKAALVAAAPPFSSVCRPEGHIDLTASATPEQHAEVAALVMGDPGVDAVITLDLPTRFLRDVDVAEALARAWTERAGWMEDRGCPDEPLFLPVVMHGRWSAEGRAILSRAGLPALPGPDRAVAVLAALARLARVRGGRGAGCGADRPVPARVPGPAAARAAAGTAGGGRPWTGDAETLSEVRSASFLSAAGVVFAPFRLARDVDEALGAARDLGYPVVLKICSGLIPHKAAAGAVRLNLTTPDEVRDAFAGLVDRAAELLDGAPIEGVLVQKQAAAGEEFIVGALRDPLFGPVVALGRGGVKVGLEAPLSFLLAPVDAAEALAAAREVAGAGLDVEALAAAVDGMSRFIMSHLDVLEADLNPIILYSQGRGCVAVDALVRIAAPGAGG